VKSGWAIDVRLRRCCGGVSFVLSGTGARAGNEETGARRKQAGTCPLPGMFWYMALSIAVTGCVFETQACDCACRGSRNRFAVRR
jgi:hypothetical protein